MLVAQASRMHFTIYVMHDGAADWCIRVRITFDTCKFEGSTDSPVVVESFRVAAVAVNTRR